MSDSQLADDSEDSDFNFEEGDTVCIRVREYGTMTAKLSGECTKIETSGTVTSDKASFDLTFGRGRVTLRPYEAEFEIVDDPTDVSF